MSAKKNKKRERLLLLSLAFFSHVPYFGLSAFGIRLSTPTTTPASQE